MVICKEGISICQAFQSWGLPVYILDDYLWQNCSVWCVWINSREQRSWTGDQEGESVSQLLLVWSVQCSKNKRVCHIHVEISGSYWKKKKNHKIRKDIHVLLPGNNQLENVLSSSPQSPSFPIVSHSALFTQVCEWPTFWRLFNPCQRLSISGGSIAFIYLLEYS